MAFEDDITRHADQIKSRLPYIKGEEATKQAIVVPLLQVLGYDVWDPREVQPEYIADFAKKKSNGQMEKIDYAVHLNGVPEIFIECKSADRELDDHDAQLARYFNATPSVRVAILTNGVRLKVFTDLQTNHIEDRRTPNSNSAKSDSGLNRRARCEVLQCAQGAASGRGTTSGVYAVHFGAANSDTGGRNQGRRCHNGRGTRMLRHDLEDGEGSKSGGYGRLSRFEDLFHYHPEECSKVVRSLGRRAASILGGCSARQGR